MGVQIIGASGLGLSTRKSLAILAAASLAMHARAAEQWIPIEQGDFGIHKVMPLGEIFHLKKNSLRSAFLQYRKNSFNQRANSIRKASRQHYRGNKKPLRKKS